MSIRHERIWVKMLKKLAEHGPMQAAEFNRSEKAELRALEQAGKIRYVAGFWQLPEETRGATFEPKPEVVIVDVLNDVGDLDMELVVGFAKAAVQHRAIVVELPVEGRSVAIAYTGGGTMEDVAAAYLSYLNDNFK